jgi:signal-transduction protein with cAMP-binding, CBS, and nucleotidyltransferase domain
MTVRVSEALNGINPLVREGASLREAIVKMTEYGFGAITIVGDNGNLKGVFTDGDIRRLLQSEGEHILDRKMGEMEYRLPYSIEASSLLNDAAAMFKKTAVDTLLVVEDGRPVGMLDIQDLSRL